MSVARRDRNACIGCKNCVNNCPMDVFYFDESEQKSVMSYPENCQCCGQCYLNCLGDSLMIVDTIFEYSPVPMRALCTFTQFMPVTEESSGGNTGA
jgi:NAD-dependent dihydropyrimidine dehydrogenase PreA subunit